MPRFGGWSWEHRWPRWRELVKNILHRWRREPGEFGGKAFSGPGRGPAEDGRIGVLERKVGQQAVEIDFLRGCLQHVEEQRRLQALITRGSSTRTLKSK